ncbi:MAG: hypothetical protein HY698_15325 [Deltaproteobacteria bacterium]|nr:hypothetical protein [Deltaproteobacteria bacterium]
MMQPSPLSRLVAAVVFPLAIGTACTGEPPSDQYSGPGDATPTVPDGPVADASLPTPDGTVPDANPGGLGRVVAVWSGVGSRTYVPASVLADGLRAVCLWGRNGAEFTGFTDWHSTAEREEWRRFAEEERVALVGLVANGSIQTAAEFQAELNRIAPAAGIPAIATAPWILRGFSFSGMRSWNITTLQPGRVAVFSWFSGDPLEDTWAQSWNGQSTPPIDALWPEYRGRWNTFFTPPDAALSIPGLLLIGDRDVRYTDAHWLLWRLGRRSAAPWVQALVPDRAHSYTEATGALERCFFAWALRGNATFGEGGYATYSGTRHAQPWLSEGRTSAEVGWVPSQACAQAWASLVGGTVSP